MLRRRLRNAALKWLPVAHNKELAGIAPGEARLPTADLRPAVLAECSPS